MNEQHLQGIQWLRENWENLREVNFKWIATDGKSLLHASPNLDEVMEHVVGLGEAERAVYAFVDIEEVPNGTYQSRL